ncbi:MAG TPA: secondary thiamine-phosphate synthase enzyme YjbQ [Polyangiaceae bacterium]|nr:secondary thiamine-phosphate synthase enzyme YjbQ [Polyangiaceae bacterium]
MHREILEVKTRGRDFTDVTTRISEIVRRSNVESGLCQVFVQHTSASLVVQENADPSVLRDLERFLDDLAPESRRWEHDAEGPDDMPAHAKSALTKTSEILPVGDGRLLLGTWQALYLWEHRSLPHTRKLVVTVWA